MPNVFPLQQAQCNNSLTAADILDGSDYLHIADYLAYTALSHDYLHKEGYVHCNANRGRQSEK